MTEKKMETINSALVFRVMMTLLLFLRDEEAF